MRCLGVTLKEPHLRLGFYIAHHAQYTDFAEYLAGVLDEHSAVPTAARTIGATSGKAVRGARAD